MSNFLEEIKSQESRVKRRTKKADAEYKISTANIESKSNIFDMNGNAIETNVKFEKTVADINLNQASTV